MVLIETQISIKISYIDENGFYKGENSVFHYYIESRITTKNAFEIISSQLKEQINLDKNEYMFIHYNNFNCRYLIPYNTNSELSIYKEFNGMNIIPFYIHIITHESYLKMLDHYLPECPICMNRIDVRNFISPFICNHSICNNCFEDCSRRNINRCCYCRESRTNVSNRI